MFPQSHECAHFFFKTRALEREACVSNSGTGILKRLEKSFVYIFLSEHFQKQTKNRNETGSNLSLGTRLTVLSKRLGRKRCCDATPDRCLECNRLTILTAHC